MEEPKKEKKEKPKAKQELPASYFLNEMLKGFNLGEQIVNNYMKGIKNER